MVVVNDEVKLKSGRIGIIRYKGPLEGKRGIFYGIELSKPSGKHSGTYKHKRYFTCDSKKGIFVAKKQILCKSKPNKKYNKNKKIRSKKRKKCKYSKSMPQINAKPSDLYKFKIPRKTGPLQERHSATKSDWTPPKFMENVLNAKEFDYNWLDERYSKRGKFQSKTKYNKPQTHTKSHTTQTQILNRKDLETIIKGMTDETAQIQQTMSDWTQWKHQFTQNSYANTYGNTNYKITNDEQQLKHKLAAETDKQRQQIQKAEFDHRERLKICEMDKLAKESVYELFKDNTMDKCEREDLYEEINIGTFENKRIEFEQMKAKQRANKNWNGFYDDTTVFNSKRKRKKKKPKARKRDYRIFYSVNIETNENHKDIIDNINMKELIYLLNELFETDCEKNVFGIKIRRKQNGFKMDFGIIIATSMHPSDYVDTFDDVLKDESFQEIIQDTFDLFECPRVYVWEGTYEKYVVHKKQQKRNTFY